MTYPPPATARPAGAGRRTLLIVLSVVGSSIGTLFAVVFTPLAVSGVLNADPLDGAWNEGSNFVNVVFAAILAFGLLATAVFPIAGAILGRLARNTGLIVFGTVVAVALVFAGICVFAVALVWGSGS